MRGRFEGVQVTKRGNQEMKHSRIKQALFTGFFALLCSQAWAVNKCTGADGKVSFQDAPCVGKGEAITVRPAAAPSSTNSAAPDWKRLSAESDKRLAVLASIDRREPAIGMTFEQLQQAMGLPNRINTGEYKTGSTQQRIYEQAGKTWYVYTDGATVTAVQASIGPVTQSGPCPSGLEIRNAETSASSMLLSESERTARQREIRAMRACGK